jgi:cellulose synthase/poly-beta-1,6-N-acetylglucosamine synthase-like glycosyltransferase
MGDFFFGVFLFLLMRWLALLYNLLRFPRLRPGPTPERPTASILVPARNEAENLRRTLPALLRQGALEVLVLDDLSEDETARVAQEVAGGHPGFRLLRGKPLPPGWRGKNWASWQLAQAARGEVLVFTDADVLWEEGALGGLLSALEGKDLVSALPRQEGVVEAFVMNGLLSFLPHPALETLRLANGQVLAFRKEAYWAMGGTGRCGKRSWRTWPWPEGRAATASTWAWRFSGCGCTGATARPLRASPRTSWTST